MELAFGQVNANDNVLKADRSGAYGRYLRNLNFRSDIKEVSISVEVYPFSIFSGSGPPTVNPYVFFGSGYFSFSPETYFNNAWINVSDLHTEGQGFSQYPDRKPYKLSQFNMPFGLGF